MKKLLLIVGLRDYTGSAPDQAMRTEPFKGLSDGRLATR